MGLEVGLDVSPGSGVGCAVGSFVGIGVVGEDDGNGVVGRGVGNCVGAGVGLAHEHVTELAQLHPLKLVSKRVPGAHINTCEGTPPIQ